MITWVERVGVEHQPPEVDVAVPGHVQDLVDAVDDALLHHRALLQKLRRRRQQFLK